LVAHLCRPAEIRAAGIKGVTAYLGDNGGWPTAIAKTAATAVAAAKQQPLALPGEAGTAALVKRLARKLLDLDHEIKDIDKPSPNASVITPTRTFIESLPGFGPGLGAEFVGRYRRRPGLLRHRGSGWRPTPDWSLYQEIPAASVAICTGRNATTAGCGACFTWPRCPASAATDRPGSSMTASAASDSSIARQLLALARRLVDVLWALLRDGHEFHPRQAHPGHRGGLTSSLRVIFQDPSETTPTVGPKFWANVQVAFVQFRHVTAGTKQVLAESTQRPLTTRGHRPAENRQLPVGIWLARADAACRRCRQRPVGGGAGRDSRRRRQFDLTPLDNCARAKAAATAHTYESELFV